MLDYLKMTSLQERLEAYKQTEEFEMDISILKNDYHCNGRPIPSEDELRAMVISNMEEWLKDQEICETQGHSLYENNPDIENGTSDLHCDRCGWSQRLYW